MDPALLASGAFWADPAPFAWDLLPNLPELENHILFETSGSSGNPKWVALSKKALLISAEAVNRHLEVSSQSCWGLALPVHHVGGFGVVARSYQAGTRMASFGGRWDAVLFRDWIALKNVTHTSLVPTQVHDLVAQSIACPAGLIAVVVGGGRLEEALGRRARELGWPVLASYGMTEGGSQIATDSMSSLNLEYTFAPLPLLPIWQIRIQADQRLEIAGPALFSGYFSEGSFQPRDSDWHLTADRAELERDFLTPLGRADRVVKVLGELVNVDEIERELTNLSPDLTDNSAVIAMEDERAGKMLVPVFGSNISVDSATSVVAAYNANAPGFRRLRPAVTVSEIPRSELGKIRRGDLKQLLRDMGY